MATTSDAPANTAALNASFNQFAQEYENMAGRITRIFVSRILNDLPPINSSSSFHDLGCGPGIAAQVVHDQVTALPASIVCSDVAPGMIKAAEAVGASRGWKNTQYLVRSASDLEGIQDNTFTHTICNFVLFAVPETQKAIQEAYRTTKPGGHVAFTTWKSAGTMQILHGAQKAIRPDLPLFFATQGFESEGDVVGDKDVPRYRAWMEEAFGKGNVHVQAMPQLYETTEEQLLDAFRSPFWGPAKKGYTDEDLAKWDDAIRNAILPEDLARGAVTMDAWCFILKKD